jgi:hypothetical protein
LKILKNIRSKAEFSAVLLKERVVDRCYDPILWLWRPIGSSLKGTFGLWEKIFGKDKSK